MMKRGGEDYFFIVGEAFDDEEFDEIEYISRVVAVGLKAKELAR